MGFPIDCGMMGAGVGGMLPIMRRNSRATTASISFDTPSAPAMRHCRARFEKGGARGTRWGHRRWLCMISPQARGGAGLAGKQNTFQDLSHDTLKDIYFAEKKTLTALPKRAKAAQSEELSAAFEKHEGQTEEQVARLEK